MAYLANFLSSVSVVCLVAFPSTVLNLNGTPLAP